MLRNCKVVSALGLILIYSLHAADSVPRYSVKPGDIFRFDYSKTITVQQTDENGAPDKRVTELRGVLVIEVSKTQTTGAIAFAATMRIDSPRVTLPPRRFFSALENDPKPEEEKRQAICRAIESTIKTTKWSIELGPDGVIDIQGRTPPEARLWLKDVETAAAWRKKGLDLQKLETEFGLKPLGQDFEILLVVNPKAPKNGIYDALHPIRTAPKLAAAGGRKATFNFQRIAPPSSAAPVKIGLVSAPSASNAQLKTVQTKLGEAVLDTKTGMIDTLGEDYTAHLQYTFDDMVMQQEVRVQYSLKRLAPQIVVPETGAE